MIKDKNGEWQFAEEDKIKNTKNLINDLKKAEEAGINAIEISKMRNLLFNSNNRTTKDVFVNALRHDYGNVSATESEKLIYNFLSESAGQDGGFLVPDDILSEVKTIRQEGFSLENYVNIEPVNSDIGTRTYEARAAINPMAVVAEGAPIPLVDPNDLIGVTFNCDKRAEIIEASDDLLADTNGAVSNWLEQWISKKSRATRNFEVIAAINAAMLGSEIPVANAGALRAAVNTNLADVYKDTAVALMNYTAYERLDVAGLLEQDPTQSKIKLLYGLYPVLKAPAALLPDAALTTPIIIGDLKEAITLFDRNKVSVDAKQIWGFDAMSFRLRDKFDVQPVDTNSIIKLELTI